MREGHERDPEITFRTVTRKEQGFGGLAFPKKDIRSTTSVIQERMASRAILHERVSGA
jgi:hypothetical protein